MVVCLLLCGWCGEGRRTGQNGGTHGNGPTSHSQRLYTLDNVMEPLRAPTAARARRNRAQLKHVHGAEARRRQKRTRDLIDDGVLRTWVCSRHGDFLICTAVIMFWSLPFTCVRFRLKGKFQIDEPDLSEQTERCLTEPKLLPRLPVRVLLILPLSVNYLHTFTPSPPTYTSIEAWMQHPALCGGESLKLLT